MALGIVAATRNNRLNQIRDAIDAGTGPGTLKIYSGTRPATGGAVTTLLATLTFSDPCAPAASGGSVTYSAISPDTSADATGTATWFRIESSTPTFVLDGDVGSPTGFDLNLSSASITSGGSVSISSFVLTEGNP